MRGSARVVSELAGSALGILECALPAFGLAPLRFRDTESAAAQVFRLVNVSFLLQSRFLFGVTTGMRLGVTASKRRHLPRGLTYGFGSAHQRSSFRCCRFFWGCLFGFVHGYSSGKYSSASHQAAHGSAADRRLSL